MLTWKLCFFIISCSRRVLFYFLSDQYKQRAQRKKKVLSAVFHGFSMQVNTQEQNKRLQQENIKKRIPVSCCKRPKDSRHACVSVCLQSVCIFQKPNLEWSSEMTAKARGQHVGGRKSWTGAHWQRWDERESSLTWRHPGKRTAGWLFIFKGGTQKGQTSVIFF